MLGLADCYNLLREYSAMTAAKHFRGRGGGAKAVELDDKSSQAHASLALRRSGDSGMRTTDREFRRAIELDPNNAIAHHWYARRCRNSAASRRR